MTEFKSTLFKTQNDYTESVLRMMYSYRKEKFVRAALALLDGVIQVMAHYEPNCVLLRYFLTVDPPAYTCRRYWDWIEPHILERIQSCSDNIHLAASSDELETCMRIYSNLELIKSKHGELVDAEQSVGSQPIPEAYLMWDLVSDRQIIRYPDQDNAKVYVTLFECVINVSKSRPTGSSNESISRCWQGSRVNFVPKKFKRGGHGGYGKKHGGGARSVGQRKAKKSQKEKAAAQHLQNQDS